MCIEIYKAEKMINGSENWNIVRVHGLSATQLQMIRVYLQGHAYDCVKISQTNGPMPIG